MEYRTDGYRVVLTYNLLLSNTDEVGQPSVSDQKLAQLKKRVSEFFDTTPVARWSGPKLEAPPDRLVYLLDHQY